MQDLEGSLVRANAIVVVALPTGNYQMPSKREIKGRQDAMARGQVEVGTVCSFGLRVVHCLAQRSSRVLFNTFIIGYVRKNEDRKGDKEREEDRAPTSKSLA